MPPPFDIGNRKQLFIDHRFIEDKRNIGLKVNPPEKLLEPVIKGENPWEKFGITYFSVVEEDGRFRMWYQALAKPFWWGDESRICYAESDDGKHWCKPTIGLVEYDGSRDNNILIDGGINCRLAHVFRDPHDQDERRRYKMLYGYGHTHLRTSPDGLHWSEPGDLLWDYAYDTQKQAWWDENLGRYVIHVRGRVAETSSDPSVLSFPFVDPIPSDPSVVAPKLYRWNRSLARIETDDINQPWPIENCRTVFCCDEHDPEESDVYHPGGVYKYPYAEDAYFMFPWIYEQWNNSPHSNDGVIDAQFAASRDGWHWMRYHRRPYIPRGAQGDFDYGCSEPLGPFFRDDDLLYQFHTGWKWTHGSGRFKEGEPEANDPENWGWKQIRLNRYRLDGFVSVDAEKTGWLLTPPLRFIGSRLELNVTTTSKGSVRVGLLSVDGDPITGASVNDCQPLNGNSVAAVVRWGTDFRLGELAGRPIRIKIELEKAKLYAFHFVDN